MANFLYNALDAHGASHHGELQARDRKAAADSLSRGGLTVVSLKEKDSVERESGFFSSIFSGSITPLDRILLTRHLSAIVRAGISLGEAIDILIYNSQKRPLLTKLLEEAKRNLEEGHPLSAVFAAYPEHFPPVFVGLIKAGEASGTLDTTLENLGNQLLRDYELMRKVRSAMVYPAILLVASMGIIMLLLTFVLPRLAATFGQSNIKLPLITQTIVNVSAFLASQKTLTMLVFLGSISGAFIFLRKPAGKRFALSIFAHLPISKDLIKGLALARFSRTLKNLIKSGVSLMDGLDIVAASAGNDAYSQEFLAMREELKKGVSFADTFRKREDYFPRLVGSLIAIGERTGSLENSLDIIAGFYDEEVDRTLHTLVTLLEPLLLLIMGLVVGGIALSVLLPIYQMVGSIR